MAEKDIIFWPASFYFITNLMYRTLMKIFFNSIIRLQVLTCMLYLNYLLLLL